MRVFVTGASGHIGSAVVADLVGGGHDVIGLARSDASADAVTVLGAETRRGDLGDLDGLRAAAHDADAVVHLAFDHAAVAAGDLCGAAAADLLIIDALGEALAGTGKTLMGVGMGPTGNESIDRVIAANPRSAGARAVAGFGERGVRSLLVAIPPVVHSTLDTHGFIHRLVAIARDTGQSGYIGDGGNHWPAGHTLDVARVYRLGLEKAPAGSQLFAATEEGIPLRTIAETIGRRLDVPAVSIPVDEAQAHFGGFATFVGLDINMPSTSTQDLLDWKPAHPGLIEDLEQEHYFV